MFDALTPKLDAIESYLTDLHATQPPNYDAFEQDKMLRRYAERMLHMTIDACTNVGIEVLTHEGLRAPENYHDVFSVLGSHNILSPILVSSMTLMVEFRNLLVYEYDVVDHMMVYSVLKKRLDDLHEFVLAMRAYATESPYVASADFQEIPDPVVEE